MELATNIIVIDGAMIVFWSTLYYVSSSLRDILYHFIYE